MGWAFVPRGFVRGVRANLYKVTEAAVSGSTQALAAVKLEIWQSLVYLVVGVVRLAGIRSVGGGPRVSSIGSLFERSVMDQSKVFHGLYWAFLGLSIF